MQILLKKSEQISTIFNENFEIRERCKGVHYVDLDESFQTHIYLQNLASIQPRRSPVKFARAVEPGDPAEPDGPLNRRAITVRAF